MSGGQNVLLSMNGATASRDAFDRRGAEMHERRRVPTEPADTAIVISAPRRVPNRNVLDDKTASTVRPHAGLCGGRRLLLFLLAHHNASYMIR